MNPTNSNSLRSLKEGLAFFAGIIITVMLSALAIVFGLCLANVVLPFAIMAVTTLPSALFGLPFYEAQPFRPEIPVSATWIVVDLSVVFLSVFVLSKSSLTLDFWERTWCMLAGLAVSPLLYTLLFYGVGMVFLVFCMLLLSFAPVLAALAFVCMLKYL